MQRHSGPKTRNPVRKPKVALACDWFLPRIGGIELHIADLARELTKRGHEVCIITTTPGPSEYSGIPVHRLKVAMFPGLHIAAPNLWKVRMLRRLLRSENVDVVHAHGMFSTLAIGCILAAYYERIPSITTHHSLISGIIRPLARLVFAVFSYRADVVSAVSEAAADDARAASGREDVKVLPNGIDPSSWEPARPDDGKINVIYGYKQGVGYQRILESERLKPGKGYWILFEDVADQTSLTVKVLSPIFASI